MKKNLLITFICALIPGFGQMYYGYMKRGVSLTLWFTVFPVTAFILSQFLYGGAAVAFFMIAIWAFSFFDTFNIRNMSPQQRERFKDDTIPNSLFLEDIIDKSKRRNNLGAKVTGWALVAVGVLMLFSGLNRGLSRIIGEFFNINYGIIHEFFTNIISVAIGGVVIFLGVKMLRKSMKKDSKEEIPPFGGGQKNSGASTQSSQYQSPFQSSPPSGNPAGEAEKQEAPAGEEPVVFSEETALSSQRVERVDEKDIILEIKPGGEEPG